MEIIVCWASGWHLVARNGINYFIFGVLLTRPD